MKKGFLVEYSEDDNEVCIIRMPSIQAEEFWSLVKIYREKGYKLWLPADERGGYLFCKDVDLYYKKNPELSNGNK